MTNKQADIWVLKKWIFFVKNNLMWGSGLIKKYPKLKFMRCYCAWCEIGCDYCIIHGKCFTVIRYNNVKTTLKQIIKAIKKTRKYKDFSFIDKMLEKEGVKI